MTPTRLARYSSPSCVLALKKNLKSIPLREPSGAARYDDLEFLKCHDFFFGWVVCKHFSFWKFSFLFHSRSIETSRHERKSPTSQSKPQTEALLRWKPFVLSTWLSAISTTMRPWWVVWNWRFSSGFYFKMCWLNFSIMCCWQFDKSAYDESVPRDLELGKLVMRIAATDVDAGENAHISYGWDAGSGPDAEYFDLDKSTGAIHLKKKITVYSNPFSFYPQWHVFIHFPIFLSCSKTRVINLRWWQSLVTTARNQWTPESESWSMWPRRKSNRPISRISQNRSVCPRTTLLTRRP